MKVETNKEYHSNNVVSKSKLWRLMKTPKYYKWEIDNPDKIETSIEMEFGSAFHKWILEPKEFDDEFYIAPKIDRRTKEGKELYEKINEIAKEKIVITTEDFAIISEMEQELKNDKYSQVLLSKGETEKSFYWLDELTGIECKCRPDYFRHLGEDKLVIIDLKTARSAEDRDVKRATMNNGYDLQAFMYREGVSKVLNIPKENISFVFIFIEKKEPYLINIVECDYSVFLRGECIFRELLGIYKYCTETDNWYGYNGAEGIPNKMVLPNYYNCTEEQ